MRKFNVNVNGKSYVVEVEEDGSVQNLTAAAPVAAAAPQVAPVAAAPAGGSTVKSPLPGVVLKFSVANGSAVKKGDKILVIEAMKMENDIAASASGTVTFLVKEGDSVISGADLASIK